MELGERIRTLRKEKKVTLVELSKKTGVAQASLSRIETGIMKGTIESHKKIAEALGFSLAELYENLDQKLEEIAYRTDATIKQEVVIKNDTVKLELLTSQISIRKFAPVLITIPAGKELFFEKVARDTDKFLWLQSGSVTLKLKEREYALMTNETIYFDASYEHTIINNSEVEARILSVTSPAQL